jgi:hypothetical protein
MTPYTVEWTTPAEDQLADIWLAASDPVAVTTATAAIDALLARDPLGHGLDVQEGLRKLRIAPLTVFYEVQTSRSWVEVSAVAYTP